MSQQLLSRFFSKKETNVKNEAVAEDACQSTPTSKLSTFAFTGTSRANDNSNPKSRKRPASIEPTPNKPKKAKGLTDFEQQVLDLKVNHLDKLLFIQSGYRYKIFGSDAVTASRILNIKLVNGKISFDFKNPSKDDHLYSTFAYASIPIERLLVHVRRLIVKGYKVGVVDQVETKAIRDNSKSKGKVFDRHLSNVYSAGTFINDEDLEKNVNGKSILFLNESSDDTLSVVSINVYITEIAYDQFKDDFTRINLESRLHHLEPIEIIAVGDISSKTERCIKNFLTNVREII
ncbi:DNA mismatch repair protein msh3 [Pichia kudriavzevii]|uniref:DNA mismatch repair protein msh3 n=1 Tax=Pichia kudriavzevii TaxID=4909 RepID=A0A1V2LST2_PICKU|nr:DNA mismatch repair protein msh3 [Pichia kudriavzevii]